MTTIEVSDLFISPLVTVRPAACLLPEEQAFYFGDNFRSGLTGFVATYGNNEDDALPFFYRRLETLSERLGNRIFFLRVGTSLHKRSLLRTKIGLRKEISLAHRDELVNIEVDGKNNESRLAIFGSLGEDAVFLDKKLLLNWMYSIVIISNLDVDEIIKKVRPWISVSRDEITGFDFDRIFSDVRNSGVLLVRFFPCDNGRLAAMSLLLSERKTGVRVDFTDRA